MHCLYIIVRVICFELLLFISAAPYDISADLKNTVSYERARDIRIKYGHDVAVPLYQSLLDRNHNDLTAGSRIAAAKSSPRRHDCTCELSNDKIDDLSNLNDIADLRSFLSLSGYNNKKIQTLFNIPQYKREIGRKNHKLSYAKGPVYVKPVPAGSMLSYPLDITAESDESGNGSLKCLVTMFLLGFCVPHDTASKLLIGGEQTIELLQRLGLIFPCEINPEILVPYAHLFPMDIDHEVDRKNKEEITHLVLVTDLHPTILNRISVGSNEDGTVMYIGPDSLALVQHLPLSDHIWKIKDDKEKSEDYFVLDLCTGSGIQAIAALTAVQRVHSKAKAICVDINDRALRFCKFNAILNGLGPEQLAFVQADVSTGEVLQYNHKNIENGDRPEDTKPIESKREMYSENILFNVLMSYINSKCENDNYLLTGGYDLILANPPFIPVPSSSVNDGGIMEEQNVNNHSHQKISKRYGLFSSGGRSGEEVLKSILNLSGRLLQKPVPGRRGILAIVSEFMDPPSNQEDLSSNLLNKIERWWRSENLNEKENAPMFEKCETLADVVQSKGILYTNEYPLDSYTYSARRANDKSEFKLWTNHLEKLRIRSISPGLLFFCSSSCKLHNGEKIELLHLKVPKTELGSIWSPSNYLAVDFTRCQWQSIY